MHILRSLPFLDTPSAVDVSGETVPVRAYQIIVHVSIGSDNILLPNAPIFPAVLDTGHSHNFSIQGTQLRRWAKVEPDALVKLNSILVNRREVPLRSATVWIYRNRPGTSQLLPVPFLFSFPEGIAVHSADALDAPRLPLLGVRGLMRNRLQLTINDMAVSLKTRTKAR